MTQDNTKQVRRRRRYSAQFKAELVAEYLAGGVSLASLAISHDINPIMSTNKNAPENGFSRSGVF